MKENNESKTVLMVCGLLVGEKMKGFYRLI